MRPMAISTSEDTRGALHAQGCLFCRRHDRKFASREHVFSEALGNEKFVLPPGVVCDSCNNGPLALGDNALIGFPAIELLRSERGLPTKSKKAVAAQFGNARVYFTSPGALTVETNSPKTTRRMRGNQGEMDLIGNELTEHRARLITRSVWKATLELLYWDVGVGAFDPALDRMRAAVLDDRAHGWAVLPKHVSTTEAVSLEYLRHTIDGRDALPACMSVFGVKIISDALRPDLPAQRPVPETFNFWQF
jgi:hypothetical protein